MVMPLASMQETAFGLMKTSFHRPNRFLCTIASDSNMLWENNTALCACKNPNQNLIIHRRSVLCRHFARKGWKACKFFFDYIESQPLVEQRDTKCCMSEASSLSNWKLWASPIPLQREGANQQTRNNSKLNNSTLPEGQPIANSTFQIPNSKFVSFWFIFLPRRKPNNDNKNSKVLLFIKKVSFFLVEFTYLCMLNEVPSLRFNN